MSVINSILKFREKRNLSDSMPIITLVVLIIVMTIGSPRFLLPSNILGLISQSSTLLILGLGETFIILLGSIDLSLAPIAAMSSIIAAMLIPNYGYLAYVAAILFGSFAGLLSGLIHTKARIPSFITTLGAMGIWTGVGFVVSNATPISISSANIHLLTWITGYSFGVQNVVFLAIGILALAFILENYTSFGRYVKAIGAGERAAFSSGVPIDRTKILAFMLCGTLAAIGGVILTARMAGGSARMADGMQMKAIAVVVLGGTAISGGIGGVMRTLVGVLIVMVLDVGMNMVGINPWFQQAVYGAVVIFAVAMTIDRRRISIIK
jgi:ribose transport system permease protein